MTDAQRSALDGVDGTVRHKWPNGTISWTGVDGWGYLVTADGKITKRWLVEAIVE